MQSFQLLPAYNRALFLRIASRFVPIALVAILGAPYVIAHNSATPVSYPLLVLIMAALMGFGMFRQYRTSRAAMEGYQLMLHDDGITVRTQGREISIDREEVRQIVEAPSWGINVKAAERSAFIPSRIEEYDRVRAIVGGWGPVKLETNVALYMAFSIGMLVCMGLAFASRNEVVGLAASAASLGGLAWGRIAIARDRSLDPAMRKVNAGMLMLAASLALRMVLSVIALVRP